MSDRFQFRHCETCRKFTCHHRPDGAPGLLCYGCQGAVIRAYVEKDRMGAMIREAKSAVSDFPAWAAAREARARMN